MAIKIISVGKKHDRYIADGIAEFQKRLRQPFDIEWRLIPHHPIIQKAKDEESTRILKLCQPTEHVILLDETGHIISTPDLSQRLQEQFNWSSSTTFIIGGAYGVNQQVFDRADFVWSMSKLVFPHQLIRLMLTEQIYRAQTIVNGEAYHHR